MGKDQPENALSCNRRDLLKAAGIGMAAMTLPLGMLTNSNAADINGIKQSSNEADVVIIGGGIAGVMAALKAKQAGASVILIDKGTVGRSGLSPFFGAYNVFDGKHGSKEEWIQSKAQGGEYLANQDYVEMFLDDSQARYAEMLEVGANINEGGRGHVHAWRAVLQKKGVTLIERTMATELIKLDGRIAGVAGFSLDDEKVVVVATKAVVLASGSGALKTPGFPCNSITHDGDSMAYRIGAEVTGKEFIDFHWTHWENPADMYDNWKAVLGGDMHVTYQNMHGGGALDNVLSVHSGNVPYLMGGTGGPPPSDVQGPPPGDGQGPPPGGAAPGCRSMDLPIAGGATAGMSAHKTEGIFPQNAKCESNIPGLYAAGDALATAGAAYVGVGTSSSASAVQGARAGGYAAEYAKNTKFIKVSSAQKKEIATRMFAPRTAEKGFNPEWLTQVLQGVMVPYYVLYIKSEERLQAALSTVKYLRSRYENNLIATDIHELRRAHELKNMMLDSEMKLRAALMRKESRGSHFREDYPARDDKNWLSWIIITKDGENMKLTKRDVPEKWKPKAGLSYREKYPTVFPGEDQFRS
jgi:succinate dehydrogenase/fumarate reductase flavoprotein subunit